MVWSEIPFQLLQKSTGWLIFFQRLRFSLILSRKFLNGGSEAESGLKPALP
jgi:hypothetical protein